MHFAKFTSPQRYLSCAVFPFSDLIPVMYDTCNGPNISGMCFASCGSNE
jgi:hypothetical protein